jgi:pimeloyl-[acyl-carrier protein] methyl ester esterase
MSLHTQTQGSGSDIVLLHGWGLGSSVWDETAQALSRKFRVTLIDLPGYGESPLHNNNYSLETLADLTLDAAPPHAVWAGWSLGGMVAMQAAIQQPQRVTGLVLVATTPRFVQGADWPHAVDARVLQEFGRDLEDNYPATMARFLALQAPGNDWARTEIRRLKAHVEHGAPTADALQGGLAILRNTDLRAQLAHIHCSALVIAGQHDTLVPLAAAESLVVMLKTARLQVIYGAGHAPFLSHPQEFLQAVTEFLHEQSATDNCSGTAPAR